MVTTSSGLGHWASVPVSLRSVNLIFFGGFLCLLMSIMGGDVMSPPALTTGWGYDQWSVNQVHPLGL